MAGANADLRILLDWMWPNFLYYWVVLYRAKWFILGVTLIFALVGVGIAVTTPNEYQATAIVMLAPDNNRPNSRLRRAANLFGQLGDGLANILGAGASAGAGAGASLTEVLATLKSRDFMARFAQKQRLRRKMREPSDSAPDASDPDEIRDIPLLQYVFTTVKDTYVQFRKGISEKVQEVMRKQYRPSGFDWDARKREIARLRGGSQRFRRLIEIERRPRERLLNVSVRWKDPVLAAEWANAVIAELNSFLREAAIAQSRKRIAYLNRELDKTSILPLRQSIHQLILAETRTIMIAETRSDYVFKVIDPAIPPNLDSPIRPKRGRLIRSTTLMGFAIAVFAAILLDYVRMLRRQGEGSPAAR